MYLYILFSYLLVIIGSKLEKRLFYLILLNVKRFKNTLYGK